MSKFLFVIILALIACLSVAFAACGNNDKDDTGNPSTGNTDNSDNSNTDDNKDSNVEDGIKLKSIADVIKDGEKGSEYLVEGVVYGTVSDGYFIADATAAIFVKDTTSVAVGDKVSVQGKLAKGTMATKNDNALSLTEATVTKGASGQTALSPTISSIAELNSLTAGKDKYYRYVTVSGVLTLEGEVYSLVEGDEKLVLDSRSNTAALASWVSKKIDVSVITCGYSRGWEAVFVGGASDIVEHKAEFDDVKANIFTYVESNLATTVYFALDLPAEYPIEPSIKFKWTVEDGNSITVEDNVATIVEPDATEEVTLKLEISLEDKKDSKTYNVTVVGGPKVSLAEATQSAPEAIVRVEGKVLFKGTSSQLSAVRRSVVLIDEQGNLLTVDVSAKTFEALNKGDTIKAIGTYTSEGIAHFTALDSVLLSSDAEFTVDWAEMNAIELKTDEDYHQYAQNAFANSNKIYKIVAPYIVYSGTSLSGSNFIRFGASGDNAKSGYTDANPKEEIPETYKWIYSIARDVLETTVPGLEAELDPAFNAAGAKQYLAYTFYACPMYNGETTWQFIIPDESAVKVDLSIIIKEEIKEAFGETIFNAEEAGKITLPASTEHASEITWESCNPELISNDGEYQAVLLDEKVTLVATFYVDEVEYTYEIEVTLMAGEPEYITVTDALALEDGVIPFIKGVIIGFGPNAGTGIPGGAQMGVYISDGHSLMFIPDGQFERSTDAANFDKVYLLADGHRLAVGDELLFVQATKEGTTLTLGPRVTLGEEEVTLEWNLTIDVTEIKSFADMTVFFSDTANLGKVIKFVGTVDSPLFLGGSASDEYDKLNLKFYYDDIEGGVSSSNVQIGGRTIGAKARSSEHVLGLTWWQKLNPDMPQYWGTTNTKYGFTGEIYAVWNSTAGTVYYQLALLKEGFTLKALTDEDLAYREIKALVATEVSAGADGTLTLPASTAHASEITWTSSNNEVLNATTGEFKAVSVETKITLTATYTVGETTGLTLDIVVTLIPKAVEELTVTQAIEKGGDIEILKDAVVVGIAPAHAGSGYPVAFYLSDGESVLTVTTFAGALSTSGTKDGVSVKLDGAALAVGSKITLKNVTVTGNTLTCKDATTGEIAEDKEAMGADWLKLKATSVIDSNEDLAAWMKNIKALGKTEYNGAANKYEVVKVVATQETPIYIGTKAKYFITFYYLDAEKVNSKTSNDSGYKIGDSAETLSWFGTHTTAMAWNLGDQWVLDNTPMTKLGNYDDYAQTATPGTNSVAGTYAFTGEFYFIFEYAGSATYPYMYVGVLGCGFNLTRIVAE